MQNILEYLIKLKADGSSVATAAHQVINQLGSIERSALQVGSSVREALSFKNFKSALMSVPGMEFLTNPYVAIAAGVGAVSKLGAEAEMTSVSFNKLVGNEEVAAKTLSQIKEYANFTPYESMDLVESAKQMLSFGVSTEQTVNMMKRLGDIAMGDKNRMSSLSLVYSQVASQGKMMGQDFLQFVNAGFNPIQELSQMTGKTTAELKDMMSKGEIGEKAVAAAIEHATNAGGQFAGMSASLAETTEGKFSTLLGQLKESATALFEVLQPLINAAMDFGMVLIGQLSTGIKSVVTWAKQFSTDFSPFLTLIGKAVSLVFKLATTLTKYLWGALSKILGIIGSVGNAIASLFGITSEGGGGKKRTVYKGKDGKVYNTREEALNAGSKGIKKPSLVGSDIFQSATSSATKKGKGSKSKDANAIATGGTRNTQITMTIGKFFDNLQVNMADRTDTAELETIVVQSLNRALAIATSTDR